ncbi:hypothetical protein BDR04DRAFT_1164695 [Suillus decipiens]|nr:hypothetical protein BDR04DRAFT_1164695 [Suillus decipiens]
MGTEFASDWDVDGKEVLQGRAFDFAELQRVNEGLVPAAIEDEIMVTDHDANEDGTWNINSMLLSSGLTSMYTSDKRTTLLLHKLKQTAVYEASEEEDEEGFKEQINTVISLLESKLEGPKFFTFSSMSATDLTEFKTMFTGHLRLKPNLNELVVATTSLGQNELWSSINLYRQLLLLESLVPKTTEATARAWIDAFFFRASAMLPSNKAMMLPMPSGFFVMEAKLYSLESYCPGSMRDVCIRQVPPVIHGALTNGREWIFTFIKFNDN